MGVVEQRGARRILGGAHRHDRTGPAVEEDPVATRRRSVLTINRSGPRHRIDEGLAVAIDGEIFQEACLARPNPDSEIYLKLLVAGLRYVSEASFLRHTEFAQAGEINVFIQRAHFGWPQISCAPHIGER